ncbi:unnamed protein product, partial [Ascophyllum nodosum]
MAKKEGLPTRRDSGPTRMASNGQSPKTEKNLGSYYRRPSAAI